MSGLHPVPLRQNCMAWLRGGVWQASNLHKTYMHITNYAVNKHNRTGEEHSSGVANSTKWSLSDLWCAAPCLSIVADRTAADKLQVWAVTSRRLEGAAARPATLQHFCYTSALCMWSCPQAPRLCMCALQHGRSLTAFLCRCAVGMHPASFLPVDKAFSALVQELQLSHQPQCAD